MNPYLDAVNKIIQEQELIIGPIALDQARKVDGLKFNANGTISDIIGNNKEALNKLVSQYSQFFGQASVEVCKDAVQDIFDKMTPDQIPEALK